MKEIYAWAPWFKALAGKIAEGGEGYLIEKVKEVKWGKDTPALLMYGDDSIDPFSFFYFLAQKNTTQQYITVYTSVGEVFGIDSQIRDDLLSEQNRERGFIFPAPTPNTMALFHDDGNGDPELLWRLFRQAIQPGANINADDFSGAFKIKNVAVTKLTQCLFLINPHCFMPVDKGSFKFHTGLNLPSYREAKKEIEKPNGWKYYKETMLSGFRTAFPECAIYEINTALYCIGQWQREGTGIGENFFQVSTKVYDDGDDYWDEFSKENWVRTGGKGREIGFDVEAESGRLYPLAKPSKGDVVLVRTGRKEGKAIGIVYKNDYADKAFGLTKESKIHVLWLNKTLCTTLGGNACIIGFSSAGTETETYKAFRNTDSYKSTFALIEHISGEKGGSATNNTVAEQNIGWESKNGNKQMKHPLNQILYGPPGTGKTWNTVHRALAIIEGKSVKEVENEIESENSKSVKQRFDELKECGQIEMVTFHQSFSYEDFIEGIKPVLDGAGDASGDVKYEIVDGVFKKIADRACEHLRQAVDERMNYVLIIDEINRGNIAKIFGELITLIEDTKRIGGTDATTVTLPYSSNSDDDDRFGVPKNLYIIGTMNTADRSIALLDTALRRRFDFIEMMPQANLALIAKDIEGVNCQELLRVMNERIVVLFDREHQIGHSYFIGVDNMEKLSHAFRNRIIPLLQEYFYDDRGKIDAVLHNNKFVTKTEINSDFSNNPDLVDSGRTIYELIKADDSEWKNPERYQAIYKTTTPAAENNDE